MEPVINVSKIVTQILKKSIRMFFKASESMSHIFLISVTCYTLILNLFYISELSRRKAIMLSVYICHISLLCTYKYSIFILKEP